LGHLPTQPANDLSFASKKQPKTTCSKNATARMVAVVLAVVFVMRKRIAASKLMATK